MIARLLEEDLEEDEKNQFSLLISLPDLAVRKVSLPPPYRETWTLSKYVG